ncbi:unnamed protein product [Darwinula stevensoni]|uniref:Uncharacterized protein n=1 Tax=Darwinula stevensoni TaxID=69355 RepID=A0A7R9AFK1_9CRUS|nr:unnamed protein product [Darwinula stevensoni]CAG0903393.1 unnamed protein product [Darwinula stevensoni]
MFANTYGKYKNFECGLVISSEDVQKLHPIPLTKVSADVTWLDVGIKVTLTQTYKNRETKPVETQYVFPVDDRAAVCGFQAEIEGRTIHGEVKKKQEAREIYEESVKQGKTAFLAEETKPDIFQVKIGNLPAGSVATITLTYVTQATAEGNALRFFLPTTIAPRYIPLSDASEAAKVIGDIDYSFFSPCPLEIQVHIETERKALSINSPTHEIKISSKNEVSDSKRHFRTEVKLLGVSTDMDRDFVMLLETEAHHQPRLILERGSDSTVAAMITLIPSFKLPPLKCDFIFVIDRSGSMGGEKMEKAKDAMQLFLKSLPTDSYFNIMSFGFTFSSLWEGSEKYREDSLHKATAHVLEMEANFGGTEIYEPLSTIFQQVQRDGYHRQVIVLTDGEVSNTEQVIALVRENCKTSKTRVFALGVGSDASHYLVNGIALAGNGEAQFATLKEGLSGKVQHLLKNSLQPSLTSVKVIWAHSDTIEKPEPGRPHEVVTKKTLLGYGKPAAGKKDVVGDEEIERVRDPLMRIKKFPCIFDGSCYAAYCIYNNPNIIPEAITLSADSPVGPLSVTFPVILEESSVRNIVHTLAAQSVIRELEEELQDRILNNDDYSKKENTAIYLGIKYNLASSLTSFVAVDEKGEIQRDAPVLRTVPSMTPHGYGGFVVDKGRIERSIGSDCHMNSDEGKVQILARLQIFDGSFSFDLQLLKLIGLTRNEFLKERDETKCGDSELATALAVAFMEMKLSACKDLWELMAKKSRTWLEGNGSSDLIESVKHLIQ